MALKDLDTDAGGWRHRIARVRWLLAVAAVLCSFAVVFFAVPILAAALAFLLLLAVSSIPTAGTIRAGDPVAIDAAGGQSGPDIGMKPLLDALPHAAIVTDDRGIVRYANDNALTAFGLMRIGDPLSFRLRIPELLAALDRVCLGEGRETVSFGERVAPERHFAATLAPIRALAAPESAATGVDFVLVVLEDRSAFEQIERMRGDFIANASHELRTPLQSVSGFIETLLGPARNDAVNRERFLLIMQDQTKRMARLVDDLLSLSRIEMRAHVRPSERIDLIEITAHVLAALEPLGKEFGITLINAIETDDIPEIDASVIGDRDDMIQVVSNLVENGIKYGRDGGWVKVLLHEEAGTDGGPGLVLSVADDGPGIAASHLPRLTERFYRIDIERSRARKGTGLGLAIVKHIVQRHKGKLTVHSQQGEGTVFSIWLARA